MRRSKPQPHRRIHLRGQETERLTSGAIHERYDHPHKPIVPRVRTRNPGSETVMQPPGEYAR
jgi:hypothetical protein